MGSQANKHHHHIKKSKAARPELASSQACAHIKRSRSQAYKTRKGASQKKKQSRPQAFPIYTREGRGEGGAWGQWDLDGQGGDCP